MKKHISLFSGIRVFDLAARNVGWQNLASCEIDDWCNRLAKQHFPETKIYTDITQFDASSYRNTIDVISGGFPCQDISRSGKGVGITGSRSGLWRHYAQIISEVLPRCVVIENSPELLGKGFERVLFDLSEIGYNAEWEILSAADFGYPHLRERLFCIAYPCTQGWSGVLRSIKRTVIEANEQTEPLDTSCHPFLQFEKGMGQRPVFGMDDGPPKRLDVVNRLAGVGNAVVYDIAYHIFLQINKFLKNKPCNSET